MSDPRDIPQAITAALLRGDRIGAIKLLRDAGGGDLRGALAKVQAYAEQMDPGQTARAKPIGHGEVSDRRGAELSDHVSKGMSDSRAGFEAMMNKTRPPTVMPGDAASQQWVWLLLGVIALAAWVFFG